MTHPLRAAQLFSPTVRGMNTENYDIIAHNSENAFSTNMQSFKEKTCQAYDRPDRFATPTTNN